MDATPPAAGAAHSTAFFADIRHAPFGGTLSQSQVDGVNVLLAGWASMGDDDNRKLAYLLATCFHETNRTMQPISEIGKGRGHQYGIVDKSGKAPYGRGYVQLTWDYGYAKADKELGLNGALIHNYDLALEPDIAAKIAVRGMLEGWFTGRKLADYITPTHCDFVNARRVINGTDRADMIALYAGSFQAALAA